MSIMRVIAAYGAPTKFALRLPLMRGVAGAQGDAALYGTSRPVASSRDEILHRRFHSQTRHIAAPTATVRADTDTANSDLPDSEDRNDTFAPVSELIYSSWKTEGTRGPNAKHPASRHQHPEPLSRNPFLHRFDDVAHVNRLQQA
jgi:hypothetical protein